MSDAPKSRTPSSEKPSITLTGTVERIIRSHDPEEPEKVQIAVEGADPLYRELRVENSLHDTQGKPVALAKGSEVDVTIEADPVATIQPKSR